MVNKKVLILTSGNVSRLENFKNYGPTLGSFKDINFKLGDGVIKFKDIDLKNFGSIYFRFVGDSLEVATLIANYATQNGIKIVDRVYKNSHLMPVPLGKSIELLKLASDEIPIPKTSFGDFSNMEFPYVVKSTTGRKGLEVWLVKNNEELEILRTKFENGKSYFAQEFIPLSKRVRVLVVGDKMIGALIRRTKWNKIGINEPLNPVPKEIVNLAIQVAKSVELDICGVDILIDEKTKKMWVIEANAAPSWNSINRDCGVVVEKEIVEFLNK